MQAVPGSRRRAIDVESRTWKPSDGICDGDQDLVMQAGGRRQSSQAADHVDAVVPFRVRERVALAVPVCRALAHMHAQLGAARRLRWERKHRRRRLRRPVGASRAVRGMKRLQQASRASHDNFGGKPTPLPWAPMVRRYLRERGGTKLMPFRRR